MNYAFDFDGTLFDTEEAVRQTYISIGVVPPHGFFGKTFSEWYRGSNHVLMHKRKNEEYVKFLHLVRPLPLLEVYKKLGRPMILTGASHASASLVLAKFSIKPGYIQCSLTLKAKIEILNTLETGIMFDDDEKASTTIRRMTRWTVCCTF